MASLAQIDQTMNAGDEVQHYGSQEGGGSGDSNRSRSPLAGFGIFKGGGGAAAAAAAAAAAERKLKADGQPPKRRGPKPDSKPALTRRQELNRQAQRTHRERKEQYIKQLEQEVLRLRDVYAVAMQEREAYAVENQKLKDLLSRHGISYSDVSTPTNGGANSGGTFSGSYPTSNQPNSRSPPPGSGSGNHNGASGSPAAMPPRHATGVDYDQTGIDFVLALERPCMDHMQMLCVKSMEYDGEFSGHALMATCPPQKHIIERPEVQYPHKAPDNLHANDLMKLLDLSNRLPLDGEITPVMAWAFILRDHRLAQLSAHDFASLKSELLPKVRCYGFGAVLEEFEVKDALEAVLASQMENFHMSPQPAEAGAMPGASPQEMLSAVQASAAPAAPVAMLPTVQA